MQCHDHLGDPPSALESQSTSVSERDRATCTHRLWRRSTFKAGVRRARALGAHLRPWAHVDLPKLPMAGAIV